MNPSPRRVAIVGGVRIPFARANTAYNEAGNQQMLTAVLKSLVARFGLENRKVGEVAAGAVIKHSRDWNLARESTLGSGLHLGGRDRLRHRRRCRFGERHPAHLWAGAAEDRSFERPRPLFPREDATLAGGAPGSPEALGAGNRRAAHRPVDGAARRGNREGMARRPRRAG